MKMKWYVGMIKGELVRFRSELTPEETKWGQVYNAVIGPFRTKRAALWAEKYGYMNHHFYNVKDAEKLSRMEGEGK